MTSKKSKVLIFSLILSVALNAMPSYVYAKQNQISQVDELETEETETEQAKETENSQQDTQATKESEEPSKTAQPQTDQSEQSSEEETSSTETNSPEETEKSTDLSDQKQKKEGMTRSTKTFNEWFTDSELAKAVAETNGKVATDLIDEVYLESLGNVNAANRGITSLAGIERMTGLTTLDISGNLITDFSPLNGLTNLNSIRAIKCAITDISFLQGKELVMVKIGNLGGANVNDYEPSAMDNKISDLSPLKNQLKLDTLDLEFTGAPELSTSNIGSLPALEYLYAMGNGIQDISGISGSPKLKVVSLSRNNISNISPLSGANNMQEVLLESNQIKDLSALNGSKTSLYNLRLTDNKLTNQSIEDIRDLKNIYTLYINENQDVTDLSPLNDYASLNKINLLNFSNTGVTTVEDVKNLVSLTNLSFRVNGISDISSLENLTNLKTFEMGVNEIQDISVMAHLPNLQTVGIENNQISDISVLENHADLGQLRANNQEITVDRVDKIDGQVIGLNIIKNGNNSIVTPTYTAAFPGSYDSATCNSTWQLPVDGADNDEGDIEYIFTTDSVTTAKPNKLGVFSGKVKQPWKAKYSLDFNLNGGTTQTAIDRQLWYYDELGTQPSETPSKIGANFIGWFWTDNNGATHQWDFNTDKMPYNNVTLYANYEAIDYTLSFDLNGGDGTAPANQILHYQDKANAVENPVREGYTFEGWQWTDAGSITSLWDFDTTQMPANDVLLTAQWKLGEYKLSFDLKGGESQTADDHKTQTNLHMGDFGTKPTEPVRQGYVFSGWKWNDKGTMTDWLFGQSTMPGHDVELEAQWAPIDYKLSFNLDGGSSVNEGDHATQSNLHVGDLGTKPNNPVKNGYTFEGWQWTEGGVTKGWEFGKSTMPAHDVELVAQWKIKSTPTPGTGKPSNKFTTNSGRNVKTGDTSNIALYASLLAGCAVICGSLVFFKKKTKENQQIKK